MVPEVRVVIGPDGSITVEAVNFTGPSCEEATRAIEQALGKVTERKRKAEYYLGQGVRHEQRLQQH